MNKIDPRIVKSKEKCIGITKRNNQNMLMKIIDYKRHDNITIEFDDGNIVYNKLYGNFIKGRVSNPFYPCIYTHGYHGVGKHRANERSKYDYWRAMLGRCYSEKYHQIQPTYQKCSVCTNWHNYQNFGDWFDSNFYEVENEKMCMDKDILMKGNKLYTPELCIFVPQRINNLFTNRVNERGRFLIGASYHKHIKKYVAQMSKHQKKRFVIGYYDNEYTAFLAYKQEKEKYIKQVADKYLGRIPNKLYEAMYKYEVNEDD